MPAARASLTLRCALGMLLVASVATINVKDIEILFLDVVSLGTVYTRTHAHTRTPHARARTHAHTRAGTLTHTHTHGRHPYTPHSARDIREWLLATKLDFLTTLLGVPVLSVVTNGYTSIATITSNAGSSTPSSSSGSSSSGSGLTKDVVLPDDDTRTGLLAGITLGVAAGVNLIVALCFRQRRRLRVLRDNKAVENALSFGKAFSFPLMVIRASDFLQMGELVIFEEMRKRGKLEVLDLVQEAKEYFSPGAAQPRRLIFLSHQWLAFDSPDPDGVQYRVMAAAVTAVAMSNSWDLSDVYVWVDYSSIPQKHKPSQLAAINSLSLYASIADALVVAAPESEHVSTGNMANAATYQQRAWCRAEQVAFFYFFSLFCGHCLSATRARPSRLPLGLLARVCQVCYIVAHGALGMWLATSESKIRLAEEHWLETSFDVFGGEMTCCAKLHMFNGIEQRVECSPVSSGGRLTIHPPPVHPPTARLAECDRFALLPPILGIYGQLYLEQLRAASKMEKGSVEIVVVNPSCPRRLGRVLPVLAPMLSTSSKGSKQQQEKEGASAGEVAIVAFSKDNLMSWLRKPANKELMFPKSFILVTPNGKRKVELFGDLVANMEAWQTCAFASEAQRVSEAAEPVADAIEAVIGAQTEEVTQRLQTQCLQARVDAAEVLVSDATKQLAVATAQFEATLAQLEANRTQLGAAAAQSEAAAAELDAARVAGHTLGKAHLQRPVLPQLESVGPS
ncbi:hypothetical protein T492DRAFT_837994 [Pavlovales sp. CCMP2436]|nr:hypothetical protein T492DRAFT_837994 [Pavlovales sp. CCMP2436]